MSCTGRGVSVTDEAVYLATEPIVTALAVWIGFAWSCLFLSAASTLLVFGQYGWSTGQLGSIQAQVISVLLNERSDFSGVWDWELSWVSQPISTKNASTLEKPRNRQLDEHHPKLVFTMLLLSVWHSHWAYTGLHGRVVRIYSRFQALLN